MKYPVKLEFKKIALAPQISVYDADDQLQFYVKQKLFKLKEAITVFADPGQTRPLYNIQADRVIDFSARYNFTDQAGNALGSIKRQGARSLWKAEYDIYSGSQAVLKINEESAFVRFMDGLFGEIPIVGLLSGYVFNPVFLISNASGKLVYKVKKQPALLESSFLIEKGAQMSEEDDLRSLLGILMMVLLERSRG